MIESKLMYNVLTVDSNGIKRGEIMSRINEEAKDFARMLQYTSECIMYYQRVSSFPNCNTCGDKDCKYRPEWGEQVRINCPLWKRKE